MSNIPTKIEPIKWCKFEPGLVMSEENNNYMLVKPLIDQIMADGNLVRTDMYGKALESSIQTFYNNCIWVAHSIAHSSAFQNIVFNGSDLQHDYAQWVYTVLTAPGNQQIMDQVLSMNNTMQVSFHILPLALLAIYSSSSIAGWGDLADPNLTAARYEDSFKRILSNTQYQNIDPLCYIEPRPLEDLLTDTRLPPISIRYQERSKFEYILNEVAQVMIDSLTLVVEEDIPFKKGYVDVTDSIFDKIDLEHGLRFGARYGAFEKLLNRLPVDGSVKIHKIFRSINGGEYFYVFDPNTDIDVLKRYIKEGFKSEMRRSGADPSKLIRFWSDLIAPLQNYPISMYMIRMTVDNEPPSTHYQSTIEFDSNVPRDTTDMIAHIIGNDGKYIPLYVEQIKGNGRFMYYGPQGKQILDALNCTATPTVWFHEFNTDPKSGIEVNITNVDQVLSTVEQLGLQGNPTGTHYLTEYINDPKVVLQSEVSFQQGAVDLKTKETSIAINDIFVDTGCKLLGTIIHEIGGHYMFPPEDVNSLWGTNNPELKGLNPDDFLPMAQAIHNFHNLSNEVRSTKILIPTDEIPLKEVLRRHDNNKEVAWQELMEQMKADAAAGTLVVDWGEEGFPKIPIKKAAKPIFDFIKQYYPNVKMHSDLRTHYATSLIGMIIYGKEMAYNIGWLNEASDYFRKPTKFSSDDMAANLAGVMGYSPGQVIDSGLFIHTEDQHGRNASWYENGQKLAKLFNINPKEFAELDYWSHNKLFELLVATRSEEIRPKTIYQPVSVDFEEKRVANQNKKAYFFNDRNISTQVKEATVGELTDWVEDIDDIIGPGSSANNYFGYWKNEFLSRSLQVLAFRRGHGFVDLYLAMRLRYPGFWLPNDTVNKLEVEFARILKRDEEEPLGTILTVRGLPEDITLVHLPHTITALQLIYNRLDRDNKIVTPFEEFAHYMVWWVKLVSDFESSGGKQLASETSSAYGFTHFTKDSAETSLVRYTESVKAYNRKKAANQQEAIIPSWVDNALVQYKNDPDKHEFIMDSLNYDQQFAMTLIHAINGTNGKDTDVVDIANYSNNSNAAMTAVEKLYIEGHMMGKYNNGNYKLVNHNAKQTANVKSNVKGKIKPPPQFK
jgi:hypothetical protein